MGDSNAAIRRIPIKDFVSDSTSSKNFLSSTGSSRSIQGASPVSIITIFVFKFCLIMTANEWSSSFFDMDRPRLA